MKAAKNTEVGGVDMAAEADAVQFGADALKSVFDRTRARIAKAESER
jgi:hypothetical protein